MASTTIPPPAPASAAPALRFRGRIFVPNKGYSPRSLLELRIRAGIGAILNKREWRLKWRQDGGAIRDKWLLEFELGLIAQTVESSTREFCKWASDELGTERLAMFPVGEGDDEKRAFLERIFRITKYNLIWNEEWWEAPEEEEEEPTESEEEFLQGNARMESYGQIVWYFTLELLKKRLRELPLDAWPLPNDFDIQEDETLAQATTFLIAARKGEITDESFNQFLPEGDRSAEVMDAVRVHVNRILAELDEIRQCITKTLEKLIHENNLDGAGGSAQTPFISPGPVQETWISDQLVSSELKRKFVAQVAELENVPEAAKDWHPGSDNQVLDLVHPSLYCCVFGTTKQLPSTSLDSLHSARDPSEWMQNVAFVATEPVENPWRGKADYQWIPSEFRVDDDGRAHIMSYINNLHPVKQAAMYETIASIFVTFVPMFERVLSSLLTEKGPDPIMEIPNLYEREVREIPQHPKVPELFPLEPPAPPFNLRGRTVQVIVKIAEIHLTPENPSYPGGAWHVEGSDAEQIVATGIYYFGCENITESKLAFRVIVKEPDYQQDDTAGMAAMFGLARDERLVQNLGALVTHDDRCVVFPNTLQHRVEPFELEDSTKPGVRKILAFFLVDPSRAIPSTLRIAPQHDDWLQEARKQTLVKLPNLPDIIRQTTIKELLGTGMTLEQAKDYRLKLMAERKPREEDDGDAPHDEELFFSLCEH